MKYIIDIDDFYKIYESENTKADGNKVKKFFKDNWKLLLGLGLGIGGLIVYFSFKNKGNLNRNTIVNDTLDGAITKYAREKSVDQSNIPENIKHNIMDNAIKELLHSNVVDGIPPELIKQISDEKDVYTKTAILDVMLDLKNVKIQKQIGELEVQKNVYVDSIRDILKTSDDYNDFITNMAKALSEKVITMKAIHPHWKNDVLDVLQKINEANAAANVKKREAELKTYGLDMERIKELDDIKYKTWIYCDDDLYELKKKELIQKNEYLNKRGFITTGNKGELNVNTRTTFNINWKLDHLEKIGFPKSKFNESEIRNIKSLTFDGFVDFCDNLKNNYHKDMNSLWKEKEEWLKNNHLDSKMEKMDKNTKEMLFSLSMDNFQHMMINMKTKLDGVIDTSETIDKRNNNNAIKGVFGDSSKNKRSKRYKAEDGTPLEDLPIDKTDDDDY